MQQTYETPSSVLYADLRGFGGITNKDAARVLLSDRLMGGGKSPRDRIESRTFLSREIVHVAPSNVNPAIFADFTVSAQNLYARVLARRGGPAALDDMTAHYSDEAAQLMHASLETYGLTPRLYRNEVARLLRVALRAERDRPLLLFMLFCVAGCLADTARAVELVEDFARSKLAQDLGTVMATSSMAHLTVSQPAATTSLALMRIADGSSAPVIQQLDPVGTVVGALAIGPCAITNVGSDVSRLHARIWFEDGAWRCEGLDSTNGTYIQRNGTNESVVVEPPQYCRTPGETYPPQILGEGDVVVFGCSTRYLVIRTHG